MSTRREGDLPEVWGGVECTRNRVHDRYLDQSRRSGHFERPEDLEQFAALGIQAIRYPVLWEHVAPQGLARADWRGSDARLGRLKELGLRPIVGLLHHGSGPPHTSLLSPALPAELARFAAAVAMRYPWVTDFTPVNEPLTTARFSGLYGHWYPHGRSLALFAQTLVVQCRATVDAMRAIRAVTPGARLIQTEDMGRTFSTPALAEQAAEENGRRWLSLDILCGRVTPGHPWWDKLLAAGIARCELEFFRAHPTPPDIVGLNYYVTSDRMLDERMYRYPAWSHGGNGFRAYADVEAARARPEGIYGHAEILRAAWERYHLPVALTEVHIGSTREEQLRWLKAAWDATLSTRAEGVDVRALTVWSLLGAFDWNTLVTAERGFYEPGAFDLRAPQPRPTALARMTRALATTGTFTHPVLETPGWWSRPGRLLSSLEPNRVHHSISPGPASVSPLLILGANGALGRTLARACRARGLPYRLLAREELDITSMRSIDRALIRQKPWAVLNAAGFTSVEGAERDPKRCFEENSSGPALLARACARGGLAMITFSSDQVFAGTQTRPHVESDPVAPQSIYGRSQVEAEARVLDAMPEALVVRSSAFFGPEDTRSFPVLALTTLARGESLLAADNVVLSPTYLPDLADSCLELLLDEEHGVVHLANAGEVSLAELATRVATLAGLSATRVVGRPLEIQGMDASSPVYRALGSERLLLMPALEDALGRFLRDCNPSISRQWAAPANTDAEVNFPTEDDDTRRHSWALDAGGAHPTG